MSTKNTIDEFSVVSSLSQSNNTEEKLEFKELAEKFENEVIITKISALEKVSYRTATQISALIEIVKRLEERIINLTTTSEEVLNTVDTNNNMVLEYITGQDVETITSHSETIADFYGQLSADRKKQN